MTLGFGNVEISGGLPKMSFYVEEGERKEEEKT